jgi:hypothetical protein
MVSGDGISELSLILDPSIRAAYTTWRVLPQGVERSSSLGFRLVVAKAGLKF